MSLFRKKAAVPEEQALLAAMDDLRERPKAEPGTEDVPDLSNTDADTEAAEIADAADADGVTRLDFGAVRVPAVDGMQVRAEIDDEQQVVAVSVMLDDTVLQLQAFAAPKSEDLWDEVRQEIAEGIRGNQGKAREADGPFGRELHAEVVVTDESGKTLRQPARFIGVDGPRWFLRGVITGAGASEPPKAEAVEQVFAGVQVERGDHAAAPRTPLSLSLPDDPSLTPQ
jgi:hypothetical protein